LFSLHDYCLNWIFGAGWRNRGRKWRGRSVKVVFWWNKCVCVCVCVYALACLFSGKKSQCYIYIYIWALEWLFSGKKSQCYIDICARVTFQGKNLLLLILLPINTKSVPRLIM
jgi:hypothetical protein